MRIHHTDKRSKRVVLPRYHVAQSRHGTKSHMSGISTVMSTVMNIYQCSVNWVRGLVSNITTSPSTPSSTSTISETSSSTKHDTGVRYTTTPSRYILLFGITISIVLVHISLFMGISFMGTGDTGTMEDTVGGHDVSSMYGIQPTLTTTNINTSSTSPNKDTSTDIDTKLDTEIRLSYRLGINTHVDPTDTDISHPSFHDYITQKYDDLVTDHQQDNVPPPPPPTTTNIPSIDTPTRQIIDAMTRILNPTHIHIDNGQIHSLKHIGENARLYARLFSIRQHMSHLSHDINVPLHELERIAEQSDVLPTSFSETLSVLEKSLFPWFNTYVDAASQSPMFTSAIHAYTHAVPHNTSDLNRGIVISSGSNHILVIQHSLTMLRRVGSMLPVEIAYCGDNDLSPDHRTLIRDTFRKSKPLDWSDSTSQDTHNVLKHETESKLPDSDIPSIKFIDLTPLLGTRECRGSWALKPFAILASSFRQIILMDNDAIFFQPPETLFTTPSFTETGSILYRDRSVPWLSWGRGPGLVKLLSEIATPYYPDNLILSNPRHTDKRSSEEIDSGVVVYDKHIVFPTILIACLLNYNNVRNYLYHHTHGDKESFWLAHEALHTSFTMGRGNGGAIGNFAENPDRVCGPMYHPDHTGTPLWWNGGMGRPKDHTLSPWYIITPTHVAFEDTGFTKWLISHEPFCIKVEGNVSMMALEGKYLNIAMHSKNLWVDLFYT